MLDLSLWWIGLPCNESFTQGNFGIFPSYPSCLEVIVGFVRNLLINTGLAEFGLRSAFIHNSTSASSQVRGLDVCPNSIPIFLSSLEATDIYEKKPTVVKPTDWLRPVRKRLLDFSFQLLLLSLCLIFELSLQATEP